MSHSSFTRNVTSIRFNPLSPFVTLIKNRSGYEEQKLKSEVFENWFVTSSLHWHIVYSGFVVIVIRTKLKTFSVS